MLNKVPIIRYPEGQRQDDQVAQEEPLEIRVNGEAVAVLMRTPGSDRELVAGFALTEGIVDGVEDIKALAPCTDAARPNAQNLFFLSLAEGCDLAATRIAKATRNTFASSSCGLCGKATIENLHQTFEPHSKFQQLPAELVHTMGDRARAKQAVFEQTGGLHAAALFQLAPDGDIVAMAEDIGRHNAVDKVIGERLLAGEIPLSRYVLWVSGRASFEVVQKALVAGVVGLVCVGAPSSLAVDLANESRMVLVGFARGGNRYNVYAGDVFE